MAENDQERTEQATPRRREEAREKGQVARSQDVSSVAILFSVLLYFYFSADGMTDRMMDLMREAFRQSGRTVLTIDTIQSLMISFSVKTAFILLPLFLTVVVVAVLANVLQVGMHVSPEAIAPKFSKVNPVTGFRRLFSLRSLVELQKNVLKILLVGIVAYASVSSEIEGVFPLVEQSPAAILLFIGKVSFRIMMVTSILLIVLAVLDYAYQRWEHEKSLRMSRREIKDEFKQTEGDPLVKSRIRRLQRDMARKRMMAAVPKADVVVTNPTHLAVALKYDHRKMQAPVVLAKGAGFVAEKIREIAVASQVPLVENRPVAQLLYKTVKVNEAIPPQLYRAVAEILAYVYGLQKRHIM